MSLLHRRGALLEELRAEPGQFFRWRFLSREHWWQSHPYSLSAVPQPDVLRITVKCRGDGSDSLRRVRPGTRVLAEGPYGAFTPSPGRRGVVLIAGGVGITPLRAMFAALPDTAGQRPGGITLIYRASHPRDIVFRRQLDGIATTRGVVVHYLTGSRRDLGTDPLAAGNLAAVVPGLHRCEAYICGPPGMVDTAIASLRTSVGHYWTANRSDHLATARRILWRPDIVQFALPRKTCSRLHGLLVLGFEIFECRFKKSERATAASPRGARRPISQFWRVSRVTGRPSA